MSNVEHFVAMLLAVGGIAFSVHLGRFFGLRRSDPVFRAFCTFFIAMAAGFTWLAWADLTAVAFDGQSFAYSAWHPIVFRGIVLAALLNLVRKLS